MMVSFKNFNVRKFLLFIAFDAIIFGWFAYYFFNLKASSSVPQAYIFDNGPDYVVEWVSRFVEKGKIGFVNEKQEKVIPAQFDRASPFENGKAEVCNGCKSVADGEHSLMTWGTWWILSKDGTVSWNK